MNTRRVENTGWRPGRQCRGGL